MSVDATRRIRGTLASTRLVTVYVVGMSLGLAAAFVFVPPALARAFAWVLAWPLVFGWHRMVSQWRRDRRAWLDLDSGSH